MHFTRVLLLTWFPASICGLTPATVTNLSKIIQSPPSEDADQKAARALAEIYLTERLTDETLVRMLRDALGQRTQNALRNLAADSAFLDAPLSELPYQERPLMAEQKAILARAVHYAAGFIQALPDFICTIETRLLDDDALRDNGRNGKWERFHLRNTEVSALTFEAGHESYAIQTINGQRPPNGKSLRGLTTWGEFGPQMALLLLADSDASFLWSHWETLEGTQFAVLSYSVDTAHSRYAVTWCCSSIPGPGGKYPPVTTNVPYTGQIFIDPNSGSILRLTRQTVDLPIDSHIDVIQTIVEYRPVKIGGALYVCPFRSVSVARETRNTNQEGYRISLQTVTNLNEVHFTGYHKFETESRVLSASAPPDARPAVTVPADAVPSEPTPESIAPVPPEAVAPSEARKIPLLKATIPDKLELPRLDPPKTSDPQPPANPATAVIGQPPDPLIPTFGTTVVIPGGLRGEIYYIPEGTPRLPKFERLEPVGVIYTDSLNIPARDFRGGFPGLTSRFEWFAIDYRGRFWIEKPGKYQFVLTSDDGSILYIDDRVVIDNDGMHEPQTESKAITLSGGIHRIRVSYFQGPRFQVALVLSVKGTGERWRPFSAREFSPPSNPEAWKYGDPAELQVPADPNKGRRKLEDVIKQH